MHANGKSEMGLVWQQFATSATPHTLTDLQCNQKCPVRANPKKYPRNTFRKYPNAIESPKTHPETKPKTPQHCKLGACDHPSKLALKNARPAEHGTAHLACRK